MPAAASSNNYHSDSKNVLDPRVAYVMTTMMEAVINSGTGYPVRARGFNRPPPARPAPRMTPGSPDTPRNLLCIVWVGNDDYTDIKLAGGAAAAPIWAEFMKRAVKLPQYADAEGFPAPSGVVQVQLDKVTNRLATPSCPQDYYRRLHRRHRAQGNLRSGLWRSSRLLHQDLRVRIAACDCSATDDQRAIAIGSQQYSYPGIVERRSSPGSGGASEEKEEGIFQQIVWPRRCRGRTAE